MDYLFACNLAFELDAFDANGEPLAYSLFEPQQDLLEQIYQHGCYTDDLLLVWGEDGVGKTVLSQALSNKIQLQGVVVTLDISLEMDAGEFQQTYQQACQQHQSGDEIEAGAKCWVLIDHAEQLQPSALEYIAQSLALLPNATVCLFARKALQTGMLNSLADSARQDFYLDGIAQSDLEEYLKARLLAAGVPSHEFEIDVADLEKIYRASSGIPRLINQHAKNVLAESIGAEDAEDKRDRSKGLPAASYIVAGLGVILLTVGGVWFLYQDEPSAQRSQQVQRTVKPFEVKALDDKSSQILPVKDAPQEEAREQLSQRLQKAVEKIEPMGDKQLKPVKATEVARPVAQAVKERTVEQTVKKAVSKEPAQKRASDFDSAEGVLLALDSTHYVLQVAGARNLRSLNRFRDDLPRQYKGLIYQRELKNKPWYVLVLGDFKDANAARQAIQKLPKSVQNQRPWAKPVLSVQAEIKASR